MHKNQGVNYNTHKKKQEIFPRGRFDIFCGIEYKVSVERKRRKK